jgi:DMSO/TMAO reductase YedYZ heme-binding membrane subunit
MKIKNKETTFRKLQEQMKFNTKRISLYKALTPFCMLLFVVVAFTSFYTNLNSSNSFNQFVLIGLMVALFITLVMFNFGIEKRQKKNKDLDFKIYNLLKL